MAHLDKTRYRYGNERFRRMFENTLDKNLARAIDLVNEEGLYFGTFYIIMPRFFEYSYYEKLKAKLKNCVKICEAILENRVLANEELKDTYKWMIETGFYDDGMDDKFDEMLDKICAIYIQNYNDKSVLSIISNAIFKRNREKRCKQNLLWAYFQCKDIDCLKHILGYINSPRKEDYLLAAELLGIKEIADDRAQRAKQYEEYKKWLQENEGYFYYTGYENQFCQSPKYFEVDVEAKYLCKKISTHNAAPLEPLSRFELNALTDFRKLDEKTKIALCEYSHKKKNQSEYEWEKFIKSPIDEQIRDTIKNRGII